MSKQDFETRRRRLASGACPVHGVGVTQTGHWYIKADGTSFAIASCPRGDCDITVRGDPRANFWEATPETAPLVGEAPDTSKVYREDDLTVAFGMIDRQLAMRAYDYWQETGGRPEEIVEAALMAYLEARGR